MWLDAVWWIDETKSQNLDQGPVWNDGAISKGPIKHSLNSKNIFICTCFGQKLISPVHEGHTYVFYSNCKKVYFLNTFIITVVILTNENMKIVSVCPKFFKSAVYDPMPTSVFQLPHSKEWMTEEKIQGLFRGNLVDYLHWKKINWNIWPLSLILAAFNMSVL